MALCGCLVQAAKYFTFIFFGLSVFVILVFGGFVVCHCYRRLRYDRQRAREHELQVRAVRVVLRVQVSVTWVSSGRECHDKAWLGLRPAHAAADTVLEDWLLRVFATQVSQVCMGEVAVVWGVVPDVGGCALGRRWPRWWARPRHRGR